MLSRQYFKLSAAFIAVFLLLFTLLNLSIFDYEIIVKVLKSYWGTVPDVLLWALVLIVVLQLLYQIWKTDPITPPPSDSEEYLRKREIETLSRKIRIGNRDMASALYLSDQLGQLIIETLALRYGLEQLETKARIIKGEIKLPPEILEYLKEGVLKKNMERLFPIKNLISLIIKPKSYAPALNPEIVINYLEKVFDHDDIQEK